MRIRSVEDRLFLRFRRTGDARALGRLFDRTARDLWNVARYVAADRASADDLVQTTFLRAIEGAAGWDATRPVMPWLVGILTHQAMDLRRARERAARAALPPPRSDAGPDTEAADAELRAACVAAVRSLRAPYGEVVSLHLDAGLNAVEIGQRLGRPVDTVRKQLGRGLALLRRALPAGFAGAFAVGMTPARALAAIRDVVTARATAVGTSMVGAGATMALGGLALQKVAVAASVLTAGLAAFAWWSQVGTGTDRPADSPPTASWSGDGQPSPPGLVADASTALAPDSGRSPVVVAPTAAGLCTVRGRCVDARNGAVLADCVVLLQWGLDNDACLAAGIAPGRDTMTSTTTSADGRFELEFEPRVMAVGRLGVSLVGYVRMHGDTVRVAVGGAHDFGDIRLVPGCMVAGRVLDTHGRPQGGVTVTLRRQVQDSPPGWRLDQEEDDRTADDGAFEFRHAALPPGRYGVEVDRGQFVEPQVVDIDERRELHVSVTTRALDEIPSIAGVVVDETGAGVTDVAIARIDARGDTDDGHGTDHAGRFRILRAERDGEGPFQLQLQAEGFEVTTTDERYAWDTTGLRLSLRRGVPVTLEVRDADTGEPIERFGVRWRRHPYQSAHLPMRAEVLHEGLHATGRLTFPMWRGRAFVEVVPTDPDHAPSALLVLEVVDDLAPQQVRLAVRRPTTLRVETQDGDPVAGTEVEVLQPMFDRPVDCDTFVPRSGESSTSANVAHELARGVTSETGSVRFMLPHDRPVAVRVLGPGHPVAVLRDRTFDVGENVIVVPRGATLRGVLTPVARLAEFSRLSVHLSRSVGAYEEFPPRWARRRIEPDPATGAFEMSGVPEGTWALKLTWTEAGEDFDEQLAEVPALRDGETREATFTLDAIQFARVRLHLVAGGETLDGTVHAGVSLPLRGGIAAGRVRAGDHLLTAYFHRGPRRVEVPLRPGFTARAGETIERRYELTFGTLRLRLVDAAGQPVAGAQVDAALRDGKWGRELSLSGSAGRIEALDMPVGTYRLRIHRLPLTDAAARAAFLKANPGSYEELSVDLAEVEVTATDAEHRVVVPPAALR